MCLRYGLQRTQHLQKGTLFVYLFVCVLCSFTVHSGAGNFGEPDQNRVDLPMAEREKDVAREREREKQQE